MAAMVQLVSPSMLERALKDGHVIFVKVTILQVYTNTKGETIDQNQRDCKTKTKKIVKTKSTNLKKRPLNLLHQPLPN